MGEAGERSLGENGVNGRPFEEFNHGTVSVDNRDFRK